MIEAFIQTRIQQGAFQAANPLLIARAFAGMIAHIGMIGAVYAPHLPPLGDRQTMVDQMVSVFLSGLKKEVSI